MAARNDPLNLVGQLVQGPERGYLIDEVILSTGHSVVYRARQVAIGDDDVHVGRVVAFKVLHPETWFDSQWVLRFELETKIVGQLKHDRIVPVYDLWQDQYLGWCIVMRHMERGSLRRALADRGAWSLEDTSRIVQQVAEALDVLHRAGLVHRDIKPANILLDSDGNACLTDFGIVKDLSGNFVGNMELTKAGTVVGTLIYASPEQINRREPAPPVTQRADIYSLGVVIYEMLTGLHPFVEAFHNQDDMIMKHLAEPLPDIHQVLSSIPEAVNDVLQKATAKRASDRYHDAPSMAAALWAAITKTESGHLLSTTSATRFTIGGISTSENLATFETSGPTHDLASYSLQQVTEFTVEMPNKPSELWSLLQALSFKGIHLGGFFHGTAIADTGTFSFAPGDPRPTQRTLSALRKYENAFFNSTLFHIPARVSGDIIARLLRMAAEYDFNLTSLYNTVGHIIAVGISDEAEKVSHFKDLLHGLTGQPFSEVTQYIVLVENRAGAAFQLSELLRGQGFNLDGFLHATVVSWPDSSGTGVVNFAAEDSEAIPALLGQNHYQFHSTRLIYAQIPAEQDVLFRLTDLIAEYGFNLTSIYGAAGDRLAIGLSNETERRLSEFKRLFERVLRQ